MSSNAHSLHDELSVASRNPRRRPRVSAEDGNTRQQPQRKRHKAIGDGFRSDTDKQNEKSGHQLDGRASLALERQVSASPSVDIPVRGKHGVMRRVKDEGSVVLTKNANYVVKQLPSLPKNLRLGRRETLHGAFSTSAGRTLALTRTQAFVWDYTSSSFEPATRIFTLQHPSRTTEPLPLGALVTTGSGTETGLVVINATSGKITYWESVENADALSLFEQRRNGIPGSCGSLHSEETVVDIEDAEAAGFLLVFSSGRVAQLLLRDAQSRPAISVRFLHSQRNQTGGGLFGGLKSVFVGQQWLKIVAAKAQTSVSRGSTDAILATEDATLQFWQLNWSGQIVMRQELDAKLALEAATSPALVSGEGQAHEFKVVDFAIVKSPPAQSMAVYNIDQSPESQIDFDLLVLVKIVDGLNTSYALVELETTDGVVTARRTLHLHESHVNGGTEEKPRLYLPGVQTACVVFLSSIVLISLATLRISPESQFLMDAEKLPEPFQDAIHLKDDHNFSIAGVGVEDNSTNCSSSSLLLLVENHGVIRVTIIPPASEDQAIERARISAKSKIEEAIFFGSIPENPLDLLRSSEKVYETEELGSAALKISHEVCASESDLLPNVVLSVEQNLELRARVLRNLATYLKQYTDLSSVTRCKLRFYAEKIAAARKVWSSYNERVNKAGAEMRLLPQLLLLMDERHKTVVDEDDGEQDRVRQWFIKDVWRMENLVAWPWRGISNLEKANEIQNNVMYFEYISDADDIVLNCLQTAFKFREENAALYNIDDEKDFDLASSSGLPRPSDIWTSTTTIQVMLPEQIKATIDRLLAIADRDLEAAGTLPEKISKDIPQLVDAYCTSAEERVRWYAARQELHQPGSAEKFRMTYEKERNKMLLKLVDLSQTLQGLDLAEKYHDMDALVVLVQDLSSPYLVAEARADDHRAQVEVVAIEKRIKRYFEEYKDYWANAFYARQISRGAFNLLLDQASTYGKNLTHYLRADRARKKLSWMNDILSEQDYTTASQTLIDIADDQETDLWSKKVELSISKLAQIVGQKSEKVQDASTNHQRENAHALLKIQERLYEHIRHCFYDAVDDSAELQLAMDMYAGNAVKGRPALHQLLERSMENLINHSVLDVNQLVDLLTLMEETECELKRSDISGQEIYLALEAVQCLDQNNAKYDLLSKIIYRRCFLKDDWKHINSAAQRSDEDAVEQLQTTTLFKTLYEGHLTGLFNTIHITTPSEISGAGTSPDDLLYRFPSKEIRETIARDLAYEDKILQHYIKNCRLEHWFQTADEWARELLQKQKEAFDERLEQRRKMVSLLENENEDLGHRGPVTAPVYDETKADGQTNGQTNGVEAQT